jgi:hypothetical protein
MCDNRPYKPEPKVTQKSLSFSAGKFTMRETGRLLWQEEPSVVLRKNGLEDSTLTVGCFTVSRSAFEELRKKWDLFEAEGQTKVIQ